MRSIVTGLFLAWVVAPTAQAQQHSVPAESSVSQPQPRPIDVPSAAIQMNFPDPLAVQVVEVRRDVVEAKAAQDIKATTVLAIIGAVVVVVALVALFN